MQGGLRLGRRTREGFEPTRLEAEGRHIAGGAYVVAAEALGETVVTAHSDGRLRIFAGDAPPREIDAHRGAVLAMAQDGESGVVTGGDDGRFLKISRDGTVREIGAFGSSWVDCVATHPRTGLRACSVRKTVYLWDPDSSKPQAFVHPSTVGGIAFDRSGRRFAVAHYGGVTIWEHGRRRWSSKKLVWAGSHIGVSWSPDGKYVVTAMQENALHGWRLRDKADMQMSGYPAKARSFIWVGETPHLATSGADQAICWPFDGRNGPMGRSPLCVAYGGRQISTSVCALPSQSAVLVGFQDGAVLVSKLEEDAESFVLRGSTSTEVTAMAVTPSCSHILIGDAGGDILWAALRGDSHGAGSV